MNDDDDESEFENEILSEEIEELSQVLEESWLDTRARRWGQHEASSESGDEMENPQNKKFWKKHSVTSSTSSTSSVMESCDLKLETENNLAIEPTSGSNQCTKRKRRNCNIMNFIQNQSLNGGCLPNVKRRILSQFLPSQPTTVALYRHKVFCGKYCGNNGNMFMTASQDCMIRLFDTQNGNFAHKETIEARDVGWSVLDVAVSHAGDCLVYSSWSENLHSVKLTSDESQRSHVPLPVAPDDVQFCIFSVTFSQDDKEILGGSNDGCIYIYDRPSDQRSGQICAHSTDVNTVCFMDENTNVLASGADDGLVKIWDRRSLREDSPKPVGVLAGHVDGIAYISPKGDGRHLISNSKDQSIKLWDLRKFSDKSTIEQGLKAVSGQRWDYRWQRVPKYVHRDKTIVGGDTSVMTYTGHTVLQTLIRCHFSPMNNTGQKYIYTGCAKGRVIIYDLLTGEIAAELAGHQACVRDVSWNGDTLDLVSSSWDGSVVRWGPVPDMDNKTDADCYKKTKWDKFPPTIHW